MKPTILRPAQIGDLQRLRRNRGSSAKYAQILQAFEQGFQKLRLDSDSLESLLKLLEVCLANVPSSTNTREMPDISLFNHSKITAMIAGCLYYYLNERGDDDYQEVCFKQPCRQEKTMLLVSGDMSGIQNFIYSISSKGALKSLRERSFYLEIFFEHVIDEILEACGLCRTNLLYSGGGHFYLVLPNTVRVKRVLETARERGRKGAYLQPSGFWLFISINPVRGRKKQP